MAVVFKSYEIVLMRVFLHAEFSSSPKTEMKSYFLFFVRKLLVFMKEASNIAKLVDIIFLREKICKKWKKYYLLSLFSIFL